MVVDDDYDYEEENVLRRDRNYVFMKCSVNESN